MYFSQVTVYRVFGGRGTLVDYCLGLIASPEYSYKLNN